jgi:hypothetical protein
LTYELLDVVAAATDVPAFGVKAGDVGTVVEVHSSDAYEVEFCNERGETLALLAMTAAELRPVLPVRQAA